MEYPALVYRCPGPNFGPNGTTYEYAGVHNDEELRTMLNDGWHESLIKAAGLYVSESDAHQNHDDHSDLDSAPTRAEIEEKASELGIKFDGRTTDRKLLEKIEEVLRGE